MPPHFANHSSAFRLQVRSPYPMRASSCPRVGHLSRQLLEKLTESAIIKVALREDLSEVAAGCGGLRLHPAVGEGCRRWRGTGSSNPSPSTGESSANLTGIGRIAGLQRPRCVR